MLNAFALRDSRLVQVAVSGPQDLTAEIIWVDLVEPSPEERQWIDEVYGQELPEVEELVEIESSARFYQDEDGMNLHLYFLYDLEEIPRNITVGFTLNRGRLFSLHKEDLRSFRIFRMRARNGQVKLSNAISVMLGIIEVKVGLLADILEKLHSDLDAVSNTLFREEAKNMQQILTRLANNEDMNGKIRLNLIDNQRILSYLLRKSDLLGQAEAGHLREILGDIDSLFSHCSLLFNKVELLMDSTMGAINIEQNNIIKMFSVAAVILMPPTLIASIYGMNFHHMPELDQAWGYPLALVFMIVSAILPYLYFKKKRWL